MPYVPATEPKSGMEQAFNKAGPKNVLMAMTEMQSQQAAERATKMDAEQSKLREMGMENYEIPEDWSQLIEYGGKLLDPTKLSPKQLKGLGIKY